MKHTLPFFNYTVRNEKTDAVDIYIDGYIVDAPTQEMMKQWFGDETSVSYKSLRNQINDTNPKEVNIYINSGGGSLVDAMAIHDMIIELQNKGTKVNAYGRGIIASAATYILMASKNSDISENSWFMIHNVSGFASGDVNEIEQAAKIYRKFNNQVRDFYVSYTGKPAETVSNWMNKETWFTGKEAKENGFVKNVSAQASFSNSIQPDKWPFANTSVLNAYNSFTEKNSDMKIDFTSIKEAVKNALTEMGFSKEEPKVEEASNKLVTAIENSLKPITEGFADAVKNEVAAILKETGEGTVAEAIQNAVTTATQDVAKKDEVTELVNKLEKNIANKLGSSATENAEDKKDTPTNKKRGFYQVGAFETK